MKNEQTVLLTTSFILASISSDEYFLWVDVPLRKSISQYCANNSGQRDSARVVRVVLEKQTENKWKSI